MARTCRWHNVSINIFAMSIDDDEYSFSLRSQHDQCGYDTTVDLGTQMGVIVPTQVIFIAVDILHNFSVCFQYPYQVLATTCNFWPNISSSQFLGDIGVILLTVCLDLVLV